MKTKFQSLFISMVTVLLFIFTANTVKAQNVFVCNSKGAAVYHVNGSCSSLKKCKSTVNQVKVGQAKSKKLRQCKVCTKTKSTAKKAKKTTATNKKTKPVADKTTNRSAKKTTSTKKTVTKTTSTTKKK